VPEIFESKSAIVTLTYTIEAPLDRVWTVITEEAGSWWDSDFVATPGAAGIKLEPVLGGRLYEETADGRGMVWARVIAIDPPKSIDFQGVMTPAFGGPTITTVRLSLQESESGTELTMVEGLIGRVTDEGLAQMQMGWDFLFGQKLKQYAEKPVAQS
jgi:uncharacterized protein YndB with AHSA1/START domain